MDIINKIRAGERISFDEALALYELDLFELGELADEKRQARIHNAKARSAYNPALKAAGIDPKSLK